MNISVTATSFRYLLLLLVSFNSFENRGLYFTTSILNVRSQIALLVGMRL